MTKLIPLTQGKFAIVDAEDYEQLSRRKWYCARHTDGHCYAVRKADAPSRNQVAMHKIINGTPNGFHTDHVNGDTLDNRRENLRTANAAENGANRKIGTNNTTGAKGVTYRKDRRRYEAAIHTRDAKHKRIRLGLYRTVQEAAMAYDAAALLCFGNFARLNGVKI